jgi:hypothetical protein
LTDRFDIINMMPAGVCSDVVRLNKRMASF